MTEFGISHDWSEETLEAKARWFASLPLEQRLDIFCFFTNMFLELNPDYARRWPDARQDSESVQVLERP